MQTGAGSNEQMVIDAGYKQASAAVIRQRAVGNTVIGNYLYGFVFISYMDKDGMMEGRNNVGAHHKGRWSLDAQDNTLSVQWHSGWDTSVTRAYDIDGALHFFDLNTGIWRMSFERFTAGRQPLVL